MNKIFTTFLIITFLAACSGQPYELKDNQSIDELLELRERNGAIYSSKDKKKKKEETPQVIYTPYPQGAYPSVAPLTRKEGVLSFDEWKKAKEANSKEYQEYLEYREYLQTLQ